MFGDWEDNVITDHETKLNYFLVSIFNEILKIEESCLKADKFSNISMSEMHVIEAVFNATEKGENRSSEIAGMLSVSAGTLTTAVSILEKKGCVYRERDAIDKRVIRIYTTETGKLINELHKRFHHRMVKRILDALSDNEADILIESLNKLDHFFKTYK